MPVDSFCGAHIVVLNPVSKFLWDELKTEKTFDELLEAMLKEYMVSRSQVETDSKEFLMQLIQNSLLN